MLNVDCLLKWRCERGTRRPDFGCPQYIGGKWSVLSIGFRQGISSFFLHDLITYFSKWFLPNRPVAETKIIKLKNNATKNRQKKKKSLVQLALQNPFFGYIFDHRYRSNYRKSPPFKKLA